MFDLLISRSSLKVGHFLVKNLVTRPVQKKILLTLYRLKMFVFMISRSSLNLGQKLVHKAKSKENFVNTTEVTFFK